MSTRRIFLLPLCVALLSFSGCAITDPRAAGYESQIESNPSPTSVVGLWHSKSSTGLTQSYLIKEDGRMYVKSKYRSMDGPMTVAEYWYAGNGKWEWSVNRGGLGVPTYSFKKAKDVLISYNGFGQPIGVMTRQNSESATPVAVDNGASTTAGAPALRSN